MKEIENIRDIIANSNTTSTIVNKIKELKAEHNIVRNFLDDSDEFNSNIDDVNVYCKKIIKTYIEYLNYKIELMEKMRDKIDNENMHYKLIGLSSLPKKSDTNSQISDYTNSDDVDMLI